MWFVEGNGGRLLGGSNNLTGPGMMRNVEFATLIAFTASDPHLDRWHQTIHAASDPATTALINSYRRDKARIRPAPRSCESRDFYLGPAFEWAGASSSARWCDAGAAVDKAISSSRSCRWRPGQPGHKSKFRATPQATSAFRQASGRPQRSTWSIAPPATAADSR